MSHSQASVVAGLHAVLPAHMADIYGDRRSSTQYGILMLYASLAGLYGEFNEPRMYWLRPNSSHTFMLGYDDTRHHMRHAMLLQLMLLHL
jgi:hypothetical protein